jgi:hypothetical protein
MNDKYSNAVLADTLRSENHPMDAEEDDSRPGW